MPPTDRELVGGLDTATIYEASQHDIALHPAIPPAWPGARVVGRARTVACRPGDNLALHLAVERASPGEVLVVDAHGHLAGHWGEVLTVAAMRAGVVGIVIDGGLRDIDAMRDLGFPAFAAGPAVHRTTKHDAGIHGEQLMLRDVAVQPGDLVVADTDGVVVIPDPAVPDVLRRATKRVDDEAEIMRRIRSGESTREIYGLGPDHHG